MTMRQLDWERTRCWANAYCNGNGHVSLGDSVHWTTHERCFEDDVAGDAAFCQHVRRREVDFSRKEKEIVVGQPAMDLRIHELCDGKAIRTGITF